jgi:hypothetical protein
MRGSGAWSESLQARLKPCWQHEAEGQTKPWRWLANMFKAAVVMLSELHACVLVLPQDGACVKKKGREVEENSKIIENLPENQIRLRVTNGCTVLKYITG